MIRISETVAAGGKISLQVEGRLVGRYVEELRFLCFELAARRRSLLFDLTGLLFADREGVKTAAKFEGTTRCLYWVLAAACRAARQLID